MEGVLELRPNRDLALAHFFERYLSGLRTEDVPPRDSDRRWGWTHDRLAPRRADRASSRSRTLGQRISERVHHSTVPKMHRSTEADVA